MAKGLVKRGITKILTPGTMTDTSGLEDRKNPPVLANFVAR